MKKNKCKIKGSLDISYNKHEKLKTSYFLFLEIFFFQSSVLELELGRQLSVGMENEHTKGSFLSQKDT